MTNDETTPQPFQRIRARSVRDPSLEPVNKWIFATLEKQDAEIKDLQRQVTRQRNCILALILQLLHIKVECVTALKMDVLEQFAKECAEENNQ